MRLAKRWYWHSHSRCERCGAEPAVVTVLRREIGTGEVRELACQEHAEQARRARRFLRLEPLGDMDVAA